MKTPAELKPVARAIEYFEELSRHYAGKRNSPLPAESELAMKWNLSASAVNRAAHQLIGAGKLRRTGYKLFTVETASGSIAGAKIITISHRIDKMSGLIDEASRRGIAAEDKFFLGRDTMRHHIHQAIKDRVDGIILRPNDAAWDLDAEIAQMDKLNIPCVVAEEAPNGICICSYDIFRATAMLVDYLLEMGHKSIVCVGSSSICRKVRSTIVCDAFEKAMLARGLTVSAKQKMMLPALSCQSIRKSIRRSREHYPDATAYIWFDTDHLRNVLQAFREERISIPRDVSLTIVGDTMESRSTQKQITSAVFDSRILTCVAMDLLCSQISTARHWGRIIQRPRIRIEATLRKGDSVRDLGHPISISQPSLSAVKIQGWPKKREDRIHAAEDTWRTPHETAERAAAKDFLQMDLRNTANRSLCRPHGWLGQLPLQNLSSGIRTIHGVNFDIIDEEKNNGRAVIVMQSGRAIYGGKDPMPSKITLPVDRRVKAVYFLHGCGFASEPVPFAWYDFLKVNKQTHTVPIIPLGAANHTDAPEANIQDWWADFQQFDTEHVKHFVLAENGDPYEYERYLYTYEWINPEPDVELTSITVRSDQNEQTTLGLLAVTLLLVK